ncbi:MAG: hypothetical protein HS116_27465 [Planctomycetes bacterium]|nr:hypothetical protein [Planctomycetota bacterium]
MDQVQPSGDLALLDAPRRMLLISRTPRGTEPGTPWVRAVVECVRASAAAGEALVTGLGREPYDLALEACREAGGAAIVVLEAPLGEDKHLKDAEAWLPARRLIVAPLGASSKREARALRDRRIAELADRASVLAVRKGGNMAAVEAELGTRGVALDRSYQIGEAEMRGAPKPAPWSPSNLRTFDAWDYLTHYTREPDGVWPGETYAEYLSWLLHGAPGRPRDAAAALRRILGQQRILGSGRLMPAREPMVSFTARPPQELPELIRWRKGLRRWTFRPYGVAIRKAALEALGARPVRYLPYEALTELPDAERRFAQLCAPLDADWSVEAEWRLPGDLDLSALSPAEWFALTPERGEAEALAAECGGLVASLEA